MYFLANGVAACVIARYNNCEYITYQQGDHFGHVDLFGVRELGDSLSAPAKQKGQELLRKFTIMAITTCDILSLSVSDLEKMHFEFPDIYEELFVDGH